MTAPAGLRRAEVDRWLTVNRLAPKGWRGDSSPSRRELSDLLARIRRTVYGLPVEQRRAFVLALADGRTCAWVGERLGVGYAEAVAIVEGIRDRLRADLLLDRLDGGR